MTRHRASATTALIATAAFAAPCHAATGIAAGAIPASLSMLLWAPVVALVGALGVGLVALILWQERPAPDAPAIAHRQFRPELRRERALPAANDFGRRIRAA